MNVCGEDQPAASQTSWRATPGIRALEAAILLAKWVSHMSQPYEKVENIKPPACDRAQREGILYLGTILCPATVGQ